MKDIPNEKFLLFKSCMVNVEYPGIESSTKYIFDKLGLDYIISPEQTCCTGLGHYSDVFDELSTTAIAARNFNLAKSLDHPNLVMLCSTCYAINKKSANILNNNDEVREKVNNIFIEAGLEDKCYNKGDTDSRENIFHVVEVLYNNRDKISDLCKYNLSDFRIATHHACHYCKVHYEDTVDGVRNPMLLDDLAEACGVDTVKWYDHKRLSCGNGFRQRFVNRDYSLEVTKEKLLSLKDENVDILLHMCPNCQIQYDRYQPVIEKQIGEKIGIYHLNVSQLIALSMGADPYTVAGIQTHSVKLEPILEKFKEIKEEGK
ncbi:MAG: CoB--CoM heterodisulfide reductase iron-sulfur subunit B family protein [Methanobacteriaceae archaeon]|jgi:heterodisulfide reductase subunit B|nr:CoB--CoM heterodisulfide reductase iron-sulfur subunit B family protein [Methanobacteriaceae archaeon]